MTFKGLAIFDVIYNYRMVPLVRWPHGHSFLAIRVPEPNRTAVLSTCLLHNTRERDHRRSLGCSQLQMDELRGTSNPESQIQEGEHGCVVLHSIPYTPTAAMMYGMTIRLCTQSWFRQIAIVLYDCDNNKADRRTAGRKHANPTK